MADDTEIVGTNEHGQRVGQWHPRATLTDAEVELIRQLAEGDERNAPMSHRMIAAKFEISRGTVGDIVRFRRRASAPVGWRRVKLVLRGVDVVAARGEQELRGENDD